MKNLQGSLVAKVIAIFLFFIFGVLATGCIGVAFYVESEGYYVDAGQTDFYKTSNCYSDAMNDVYEIEQNLAVPWLAAADSEEEQADIVQEFENWHAAYVNFRYAVVDANGETILGTFNEGKETPGLEVETTFDHGGEEYTIYGYVLDPLTQGDYYYNSHKAFDLFYGWRYTVIVLASVFTLLCVACLVFSLAAAGHRKGQEGIHLNGLDRIPLDLYVVIIGLVISLSGIVVANTGYGSFIADILRIGIFLFIALALGFSFLMTLTTRLKAGGWWRNTVIYRVGRWLGKHLGVIFHSLPLLWKTILGFAAYFFINLICVLVFATGAYGHGSGAGFAVLFGLAFNIAALVGLCYLVLHMTQLKKAGEALASGNLQYKVDTSKMRWDFKEHGEHLNSISEAMEIAVADRMKSEHFKTELITNVSHDLKTPLTSIINYVDLLKKEDIADEETQEYIEVLDRQSARLKKLTEDLVEASKASTGNITVHAAATDVVELLNQSVGEYSERFEQAEVIPVVETPEHEVPIFADGRLLWRVFDNLLNNICKYSQPQTRVYFKIAPVGGQVVISLRNISRDPLNVSAEELMQRFVRGDSSRSTEGSGLGLSIARSLTELQGGEFHLDVDGDLFKITLNFPSLR